MKVVNVGLIGLGTVGTGTLRILQRNSQEITGRTGREITVTRVAVGDLNKQRDADLEGIVLSGDPMDIARDPAIDIVVEMIGGDDIAKEVVLEAIRHKKHVVTANKALIAVHGNEIFALAEKHNVAVTFEAAVAGGIPVIKAIREGLSANRIEWLAGIINGTCNYILTRMEQDGLGFAEVLSDAQALGYAEADPEFDVEGIDAAHKLTILASIAFGIPLQFDKLHIQGISEITIEDIEYAKELGFRIKHLGIARSSDAGIELRVHPAMVPVDRLIAGVNGVMNATLVQSDAVGPTLYYGAGAGAEPTGSAVVADIVDVVRSMGDIGENSGASPVPQLGFLPGSMPDRQIVPIEDVETAYYLRMKVINRPGVLAAITKIFGDSDISIATILQKSHGANNTEVTIIMLTQIALESNLNQAVTHIRKIDSVTSEIQSIRLENLA